MVTEDDLQFVCKDCHENISYSQKNGCSFEEARVRKKHILIGKEKREIEELKARGVLVPPKTKKAQNELLLRMMIDEIKEEGK